MVSAGPVDGQKGRLGRPWVRCAVVAVLVCLLLAAAAMGGWWWTHPSKLVSPVLGETGGLVRMVVEPGEEYVVSVAQLAPSESREQLTFSAAEVDVVLAASSGTGAVSGIDTEVMTCTMDPDSDVAVGAGPVADGWLDPCLAVRPISRSGGVMGGGEDEEELLLRFRAEGPARYKLRGVDLTYRGKGTFAQRGTQRIPANLTIVVK